MSKLWGGRFESGPSKSTEAFTSSLAIDTRLWCEDIRASAAHARMLGAVGVLPKADSDLILEGLEQLRKNWAAAFSRGENPVALTHEDIHSAIESGLKDLIGPVAGKLHTGRSRNDQVVTAFRLHLAGALTELKSDLSTVMSTILKIAEKETETLMPGLTHFQHAMPVSLAHHLLAYFWMFSRDLERLEQARTRVLTSPLGSAALAGTGFPLDREAVAKELGFATLSENSLDGVSDRDFVVDCLSAWSLIAVHLSKLAEELILWSNPRFGFVELSEAVTTGSSIMPQKKNPDVAELIRGRTGSVFGSLMSALTMMKALPLAYNRDFQEDKVITFGALDVVGPCIEMMNEMLVSAKFNRGAMAAALSGDFSNATEFADDLAAKDVVFREAHEITGALVRWCIENKKKLEDLTVAELKKFSPLCDESTVAALCHGSALVARSSRGGTAPSAVKKQIDLAKSALKS
jgi:argininosuccinate lyase